MNRFKTWIRTGRAARVKTVFLAVLLSAVLWGISLWQGEKIEPYAGDIQIRYHGQGVSRQALEQIKEAGLKPEDESFPKTAAWNVEYYVEARNPVLNFKQDVTCIMVRGEMDQIVKDRLGGGADGFGGGSPKHRCDRQVDLRKGETLCHSGSDGRLLSHGYASGKTAGNGVFSQRLLFLLRSGGA